MPGQGMQREPTEALDGVDMKDDTCFVSYSTDFFNRLNHAGFVICRHDGNENRIVPKGLSYGIGRNATVRSYR